MLLVLPIILFVFLCSGCSSEELSLSNTILFSISVSPKSEITQTVSFPTQEVQMELNEDGRQKYITDLTREIKTKLFFIYFYNFYNIQSKNPNKEYKIGGEKMSYVQPIYNEENKTIMFSFHFASSDVWEYYHPSTQEDNLLVEKSLFLNKGKSTNKFIFSQKVKIDDTEIPLGEYFYTILSTCQKKFLNKDIEAPSFSYAYGHFSNKIHTNSDRKVHNSGQEINIWEARLEELNNEKQTEIFVYSPNRGVWYLFVLALTVFAMFFAWLFKFLKDKKKDKKEKF